MAYRVLEVTLVSAKDLKKVTLFSKMRVYAVASISGGDSRMPTHRTHADREGGRSPMWYAPLRFPIPADTRGLALHVLLRAERAFGDRDVGEVFVPVQDLLASAPDGGADPRHLSYQVRRPISGRKRGVLHIAYHVTDVPATDPAASAGTYPKYAAVHNAAGGARPGKSGVHAVTAYPAAPSAYTPYHHEQAVHYRPPYAGGAYSHHHHHHHHVGSASYGYGAGGYGGAAGMGGGGGGGGGMGAGLGLGILGGAVGGMMLGDMLGDGEMDGSFDMGF